MLVTNKKAFSTGLFMAVTFFAVLVYMFTPSFGGRNAFRVADELFNSIAKDSSYAMDGLLKDSAAYDGRRAELQIQLKSGTMAEQAKTLLSRAGAEVQGSDDRVAMAVDLGRTFRAAIEDSDAVFHGRGADVSAKYGLPEKDVLLAWWNALKETQKSLKDGKRFEEAAFTEQVLMKGVEVGYNFHGIQPRSASSKAGVLAFALVFYIVYTLWWGYAIMFLFDGFGLEMKKGRKKEM